jgi:protein-disulfide isomerase
LNPTNFKIEVEYLLKSAIIALVGVSLFYFVKTLWIQKVKLSKSELAFLKFKRDQKVFATLLQNDKIINANLLKSEHKISFGPTNAKAVIDAVTNPLCGFCVQAFNNYYDLLKNNHDIQVNFIFNVPSEALSHPATQIATTMLSIYENQGETAALEAMKDWYSNRSLEKWQAQYGIIENEDVHLTTILKQHGNWTAVNNIHYTPATILNGYKFPDSYELSDLRMLIDDLEPINQETDLVKT